MGLTINTENQYKVQATLTHPYIESLITKSQFLQGKDGEKGDKGDKGDPGSGGVDITQELGNSETEVISQKVVTEQLDLRAIQNPGIDVRTPITVSIDYDNRVLTVIPVNGIYFDFYVDGNGETHKFRKEGNQVFSAFQDTSGLYYFYFDHSGTAITSNVSWGSDFASVAPIYRVLYNHTLVGNDRYVVEQIEWHRNDVDASTHSMFHAGGTIWKSGLNQYYTKLASGAPATTGLNTCLSMSSGTISDDGLDFTVTNNTSGDRFTQDLGVLVSQNITYNNAALIPVAHLTANGYSKIETATRFPFTFSGDVPQYWTSGGVRTPVTNNYYFVYAIFESADPRAGRAVRSYSYTSIFSTPEAAKAITWDSFKAINAVLADPEVRPLGIGVWEYKSSYSALVKKSVLREFTDYRTYRTVSVTIPPSTIEAVNTIFAPTGSISSLNVQAALVELDNEKSTILTLNTTPWVNTTTMFVLDWSYRYDFGATQCITPVTWSFNIPISSEDYEYWLKLSVGAGGTSHTFTGCTFALNNDTVVAGGVYEFSIKRNVVYIRRNS